MPRLEGIAAMPGTLPLIILNLLLPPTRKKKNKKNEKMFLPSVRENRDSRYFFLNVRLFKS